MSTQSDDNRPPWAHTIADPVVVDLARLVWVLAQRTGGTITVTDAELRAVPDRRQIAITGYTAEPPDTTLTIRVAPLPPCPACNDDGYISTLDGDTIGPCTECS